MKNLIKVFVLAITLISSQAVTAQTQLGAKASFQFSTMDMGDLFVNDIVSPSYFTSFNTGLILQTELGSGFFFRPELNYTQKGSDVAINKGVEIYEGVSLPIGGGARTRIDYLDLPLNVGYSFDLGSVKAQFYAGPTIGYATRARVETYVSAFILNLNVSKTQLDLTDDIYNRLELGANIGTSLSIPIRTGSIILDARYNRSITEFLNNPIIDAPFKHQSFAIGVGYMYNLSRKGYNNN